MSHIQALLTSNNRLTCFSTFMFLMMCVVIGKIVKLFKHCCCVGQLLAFFAVRAAQISLDRMHTQFASQKDAKRMA